MTSPLLLSLLVASLAALIALIAGVSSAALLAGRSGFFSTLAETLLTLPLVLPPTVLGYYLLVTFGFQSALGTWLGSIGFPLVFTWRGAVLAAAIVSLPLVLQSSKASMEAIDPALKDVARTLGRSEVSIFFTLTLPLAWRGVLAGGMLALARSLGEFGATLMVAGNIPGQTQTLPLAIYEAVQIGDQSRANGLALGLTVIAVLLLLALLQLGRRFTPGTAA